MRTFVSTKGHWFSVTASSSFKRGEECRCHTDYRHRPSHNVSGLGGSCRPLRLRYRVNHPDGGNVAAWKGREFHLKSPIRLVDTHDAGPSALIARAQVDRDAVTAEPGQRIANCQVCRLTIIMQWRPNEAIFSVGGRLRNSDHDQNSDAPNETNDKLCGFCGPMIII